MKINCRITSIQKAQYSHQPEISRIKKRSDSCPSLENQNPVLSDLNSSLLNQKIISHSTQNTLDKIKMWPILYSHSSLIAGVLASGVLTEALNLNCIYRSSQATPAEVQIENSEKAPINFKYDLNWEQSHQEIKVDLYYIPVEQTRTRFKYAQSKLYENGGQTDLIKGLKNFHVDPPNSFEIDEANGIITIFHPQNQAIHISYSIRDTRIPSQSPIGQLFRPLIAEKEFSIHGNHLFLEPLLENCSKKEILQSITWKKFPDTMVLFQSFDPDNRGKKIYTTSVDKFIKETNIILAAPDLKIHVSKKDKIPFYLITKSTDPITSSKAFAAHLTQYMRACRKFWNSYEDSYYFSALQPFLSPFDKGNGGIGGMGLHQGHFSRYSIPALHKNFSKNLEMHYAHEVIHNWIFNRAIRMDEKKGSWFNEGFTDYVSWYIMAEQKFLDSKNFETNLNENVLKPHYTSKIKNLPNANIGDNFWNLGDDNKLPYRRGSLYAFYLDNQIRLKSNNKKTLRDLLLKISDFQSQNTNKHELTHAEFIHITSNFLRKHQVEEDFSNYIIKGNPIIFTAKNLCPFFMVIYKNGIPKINLLKEAKNIYQY